MVSATGGEPWHPQASWPALANKRDPNHMEVTEEAVKCYKLNEDTDIVDNRVYINGEGRPLKTKMTKIQEEVAALKGKPLPGVAPHDVEILMSSFIGTIIGLLLVGILVFYIFNFAFVNSIQGPYMGMSTLWNNFVNLMNKWFC